MVGRAADLVDCMRRRRVGLACLLCIDVEAKDIPNAWYQCLSLALFIFLTFRAELAGQSFQTVSGLHVIRSPWHSDVSDCETWTGAAANLGMRPGGGHDELK